MARRAILPLGLLAVICGLVCSVPCGAQFPQVPKRCSVPPVAENDAPHRKVIIESIQFDGPIHLADDDIAQIIAEANQHDLDADRSGWVEELTQIGLRGAWQDRGYFHVKVAAETRSLGGDSSTERFLVTAHVNEGPQYHLGDLRFVGDTGIPEAELRDTFPLRGGEIFNIDLIRSGLQALTKLYSSRGYVDFVAVPVEEVDDSLQRISLVIRLDQQKQFRVGNVEIFGLDPGLEARLKSIARPGEIYNREAIYDFYQKNESLMPSGLSFDDGAQARRDVKTGIVDLMFDFRLYP